MGVIGIRDGGMDFRIEKRFIADWTESRIKRITTGISSDRPFSGLIVAPLLAIFMMALPAVWSGEALAQDVPEGAEAGREGGDSEPRVWDLPEPEYCCRRWSGSG